MAFKKLVELVQSGDAILMAGAGCSGALYPAWTDFVNMMEIAALEINPKFEADKKNFLMFADEVKSCLGNGRYYGLIYDTFKPGETTRDCSLNCVTGE